VRQQLRPKTRAFASLGSSAHVASPRGPACRHSSRVREPGLGTHVFTNLPARRFGYCASPSQPSSRAEARDARVHESPSDTRARPPPGRDRQGSGRTCSRISQRGGSVTARRHRPHANHSGAHLESERKIVERLDQYREQDGLLIGSGYQIGADILRKSGKTQAAGARTIARPVLDRLLRAR